MWKGSNPEMLLKWAAHRWEGEKGRQHIGMGLAEKAGHLEQGEGWSGAEARDGGPGTYIIGFSSRQADGGPADTHCFH